MYCIEPEDLLINIYKNRITYEPYDQDVCKLFNLLFLNRTEAIIKRIGYMEPIDIKPYEHDMFGIHHDDVYLFWQEKDYPYIIYCKYINGWYAYLHLVGTNKDDLDYSSFYIDQALTLHDMYKNIHVYDYKQWDDYVSISMSDLFHHDLLDVHTDTREDLYYPKDRIYNRKRNNDDDIIACISYQELYSLIDEYLPSFLVPYLNDTCFIAGGFLAKLSRGIVPEDGDIDIWIVRGENDGYTHLNILLDSIEKNGYTITNNGFTFICSKEDQLPIQIIPSSYRSLMDIIDNFDTSCTSIAYNGKEIFASYRFVIYIANNQSYCIRDNILRSVYEKYKQRGYEIVLSNKCVIIDNLEPKNNSYRDDFRMRCFDINLFGYDNDEFEVEESRYSDAFMTNRFIKVDSTPNIVELCNKLSMGTYIDNEHITNDDYNDIINIPGYSSIDYYLQLGSYVNLNLVEGLNNDIAVRLFCTIQ